LGTQLIVLFFLSRIQRVRELVYLFVYLLFFIEYHRSQVYISVGIFRIFFKGFFIVQFSIVLVLELAVNITHIVLYIGVFRIQFFPFFEQFQILVELFVVVIYLSFYHKVVFVLREFGARFAGVFHNIVPFFLLEQDLDESKVYFRFLAGFHPGSGVRSEFELNLSVEVLLGRIYLAFSGKHVRSLVNGFDTGITHIYEFFVVFGRFIVLVSLKHADCSVVVKRRIGFRSVLFLRQVSNVEQFGGILVLLGIESIHSFLIQVGSGSVQRLLYSRSVRSHTIGHLRFAVLAAYHSLVEIGLRCESFIFLGFVVACGIILSAFEFHHFGQLLYCIGSSFCIVSGLCKGDNTLDIHSLSLLFGRNGTLILFDYGISLTDVR